MLLVIIRNARVEKDLQIIFYRDLDSWEVQTKYFVQPFNYLTNNY